jgi:hypothetical protein
VRWRILLSALTLFHSANAFQPSLALRQPSRTGTNTGVALISAAPITRGALQSVVCAAFKDFATFESEVRAYLQTLDETALNDPEAPSPLAYKELQSNGRVDLVEGAMQFGGYLTVSEKLGVRIQKIAAKGGPLPGYRVDGGVQFAADDDSASKANVVLSAQAKEDKMAADLARLQKRGSSSDASAASSSSTTTDAWVGDRLTPLRTSGGDVEQTEQGIASAGNVAAGNDGARYIRLDGLQRANALLLLLLVSVGFGAASAEMLDSSTIETARLAGGVLGVAHVFIAGFGAFSAVQAKSGDENPVLWFFKCLLTGAGGLAELKRRQQA